MYTFSSKVRYSEVDISGRMRLDSIVNYFQDCSTFQSEDLGMGWSVLQEMQHAWVLNTWQVVVEEAPALCDDILISTWPHGFKGCYGYRNFLMTTPEGKPLAYANTIWVYVDITTGRPDRCPEQVIAAYPLEAPYPMEPVPRKIAIPDSLVQFPAFPVMPSHIDTNHHVNNCRYVQMATDHLPQGFTYRQMRAEYRTAALPGSTIIPSLSVNGTTCTVVLSAEDGKIYSVLEFTA